ncbi:DUF418 domain-containing protein [Alkalimonas sp. NCh-2]|uniref:DUF418 domain-containing protein n=1 Tax=Alkalimonas sp. NCh-2 TaxID=3144846 RepID=UPI0031F61858
MRWPGCPLPLYKASSIRCFPCCLALLHYGLQLWFSYWWLLRYRYGPMEWLWRSLTYGKRQAFQI